MAQQCGISNFFSIADCVIQNQDEKVTKCRTTLRNIVNAIKETTGHDIESDGYFNVHFCFEITPSEIMYEVDYRWRSVLGKKDWYSPNDVFLLLSHCLETKGYAVVYLDLLGEHGFILFNTEQGLTCIDSYVEERKAEKRYIDKGDLCKVFESPDGDIWGKVFKCNFHPKWNPEFFE